MKKRKLLIVIGLIMCIMCSGCKSANNVQNTPNSNETISNTNYELLDSAVTLGTNGEYYESNALSIVKDGQFVFKVDANRNFSTLYMYNAKKRMGSNFLDGMVPNQELANAYWQVRVYDEQLRQMQFAVLHNLTSQLCTTSSWDDAFVFESGHTYYFVIDILKSASGTYYFSLY